MTRKLSGWIDKARTLESTLAARVEGAARQLTRSTARQPLEIVHAIVDAIEREVQPAGRGRRLFPFNHIRVVIAASSPRQRAYLEAACEGPPSLQQRIVDGLEAAGCTAPPISITIEFVEHGEPEWAQPEFDVQCARGAPIAAPAPETASLELTITHGTTGRSTYTFAEPVVALGRGDEVRDSRQRLLRTNQVAFADGDDPVNNTVSRRHARIEKDARGFRLFDDGSTQGTSVIRGGRGLPVSRGTRGLLLQSGDEIVLGQARLRVRIH